MLSLELLFAFLLLGAFVGLMAGLFGVGGGAIMVSILTTLFLSQGFPIETVVHTALGTSMAAIIITSFSSLRAHHAKGAVLWEIVKSMSPGILIGAFLSAFLLRYLSAHFLALFFAIFISYISIQMLLDIKIKSTRTLMGRKGLLFSGASIASLSALVSIGGGSLTVPFLCWQNIPLKQAIGTSAAIGFPLSIAATFGYLISSGLNTHTPTANDTVGFIYFPAVFLISISSFLMAPYGATLAHALPTPVLKKAFAVLLIVLSINMLLSIF